MNTINVCLLLVVLILLAYLNTYELFATYSNVGQSTPTMTYISGSLGQSTPTMTYFSGSSGTTTFTFPKKSIKTILSSSKPYIPKKTKVLNK